MLRKEIEAVPEGNSPVPQQEEFGCGDMKIAVLYRILCELIDICFDQQEKKLD